MLYNDILFSRILLFHLYLLITNSAYGIYDKMNIKTYLLGPKNTFANSLP